MFFSSNNVGSIQKHLIKSPHCNAIWNQIALKHFVGEKLQKELQSAVNNTAVAGSKTTGLEDEKAQLECEETKENEEIEVEYNEEDDNPWYNNASDSDEELPNEYIQDNQMEVDDNHTFNGDDDNNNITSLRPGQYDPSVVTNDWLAQILQNRNQIQHNNDIIFSDEFVFMNNDRHQVKLLNILEEANAPHSLYQEISNWAKEAYRQEYHFNPHRTTREAEVKYLQSLLNLTCMSPEEVLCPLPGPQVQIVPVTRFDFTTQLISLITDPRLVGDINNLDVNPNDPFGKYDNGGVLSTFNSGSWYNKAYNHCVKNENDFLCPIIFACDESKLNMGKTGCWPLNFTTSIFNQQMRNRPLVWRPLGYIYELGTIQSDEEASAQTQDLKYSRLHAIFAKVLETFIIAQRSNVLDNVKLNFGGFTKTVNIKVPCGVIIGDMQGGDKICCSSPSYSNKINRVCRKCNVKGSELDNPEIECKKISMEKMKEYVKDNKKEKLTKYNQYNVMSAWYDVCYGGCKYGVFSAACPIEALHALKAGLIPDCLTILFSEEIRGSRGHIQLDLLAKKMTAWNRQFYISSGARKEMPRLLWKNGITNLSQLPGAYKVGILLTVVVISMTEEGEECFDKLFKYQSSVHDMRYCFQLMLCYLMWLKKDTYWRRGDKIHRLQAKEAIKVMLSELSDLWPRVTGQGWAKPKYHEQLHVPDDIERNGAPMATSSEPTEHHHIDFVKKPAKRTQRRQERLDAQIANRYTESYVIKTANDAISKAFKNFTIQDDMEVGGQDSMPEFTRCQVGNLSICRKEDSVEWDVSYTKIFQDMLKKYSIEIGNNTYQCATNQLSEDDSLLWERINDSEDKTTIEIYSEYKRNGMLFRSHPFYEKKPWYDWVMVRWSDQTPKKHQPDNATNPNIYYMDGGATHRYCYTPCKIVGMFYRVSKGYGKNDEFYTVVWPCKYKYKKSTVFSTKWEMDYWDKERTLPRLEFINCSTIVRHCLMIPRQLLDESNSRFFEEIWPIELWADEFLTTSIRRKKKN